MPLQTRCEYVHALTAALLVARASNNVPLTLMNTADDAGDVWDLAVRVAVRTADALEKSGHGFAAAPAGGNGAGDEAAACPRLALPTSRE